MAHRVLLLEFNELCPRLLDEWMEDGALPNFRRFHDRSEVFVTKADASPPALEPWIQWYSLHTGLSYQQHRVFHLADGPKASHPDIWTVVRQMGRRTCNCSSMNAKGFDAQGSVFIPDPWCTSERASPAPLNAFSDFVASQVQEYTNPVSTAGRAQLARFVVFMLSHGLQVDTVARVLRQLATERLQDRRLAWKRAVALDWLQRDVFLHYFRKNKPHFSSFFLNSTAHLQHAYWRCMEPDAFEVKPNTEDERLHRDAILFGYQNMDRLLADFFALESDGVTLVLASALSQQPFLRFEHLGGQNFYRPLKIEALLKEVLEVAPDRIEPVMTHQYQLRFRDERTAAAAEQRLRAVCCDGQQLLSLEKSKESIVIGCQLNSQLRDAAEITFGEGDIRGSRFFDFFYRIDETKSGCHHPDGVLWFKTGRSRVGVDVVSILDVFPTLLALMELEYQPSQSHPFTGRNILTHCPAHASVS
jgi:hypothetical protein